MRMDEAAARAQRSLYLAVMMSASVDTMPVDALSRPSGAPEQSIPAVLPVQSTVTRPLTAGRPLSAGKPLIEGSPLMETRPLMEGSPLMETKPLTVLSPLMLTSPLMD